MHVVVRVDAEVRRDQLLHETPLTNDDVDAPDSYYRAQRAVIDRLLAEDAAYAETFQALAQG